MIKKVIDQSYLLLAFCCLSANLTFAQADKVTKKVKAQTYHLYENFPSKFIPSRDLEIWLPENYEDLAALPVLYMFDGQNIFHGGEGFGGKYNRGWEVDETISKLIKDGKLENVMVVGLQNAGPRRLIEYMPAKPSREITEMLQSSNDPLVLSFKNESPKSDDYLSYLVSEVKPFVDANYKTKSDQANTFIAGSSMGGLMSAYAICEYPDVFFGAACFSTHWPIFDGVFIEYLKDHLPDPTNHKIYFDFGTEGLDAMYKPFQSKADQLMAKKGYVQGVNWITKKFEGEDHKEADWRKRFHIPMMFLMEK